MWQKLVLLSAGLSFFIITWSQGNIQIKGIVKDSKTNEPLPAASVFFADEKIGTIADSSGRYVINNIPPGHHVLEVSHTGYSPVVEHLAIYSSMEKNFSLSSILIENQGVIVTGVAGATNTRKAPVQVNTMRRQSLLQVTSTNIIDAITRMPGVSQVSSGPAVSKPIIRGLGYNRVVTVNEGVRQEGQQWGDEHGIEMDELSIVRAEVWKGPASLIYGSDALAGVVNFITHTPVQEGTIKGNILANYQGNASLAALHGSLAGNKTGFNWNFYGTWKSAGDYRNRYDGRVLNSRFNERNFGGYAGFNKRWGYAHLVLGSFDQRTGVIEGDRDDATGKFLLYAGSPMERTAVEKDFEERTPVIPYQRIRHHKLVSDNNFVLGRSRLKINLAYQQNLREEFGNPEDRDERELGFKLGTFNYSFQWQLPEVKEWHTTAGLNGMRQLNRNNGTEMLIPDYKLFDAGIFLYTQRFFDKSTFSGGLRVDHRALSSEGLDRNFSNVSASAGISLEPTPSIVVKANLARGFRAPTIAELSSNGVHEGTNRYEYGEPGLVSETSLQGDAGIELNYEHFNFSFAVFYNDIRDFVFYHKLLSVSGNDSLVNVDGEDIPAFKFFQQDARLYGIEAVVDLHPHPLDWLHFAHTFSWVNGRFSQQVDGNLNLPLVPPPRWIIEVRSNFNKAGKQFRNVYARLEADVNFRQDKPFSGYRTETPTPAYTLLNAGLGADVAKKEKILFSLHLSLNNLSDIAYQQHQSRLKYTDWNYVSGRRGVFNMGRNFSVKLSVPFSFKAF